MKKFINYKNLSFLLIFLLIILTSSLYSSLITYYYADNLFTRFVHDISQERNFFEILVQKYNIYGLPFIPFNPTLNLLSYFNYDLKSPTGYLLYLFLLRLFELITYSIYVFYFSKSKITPTSLIIFLLFIFQFNVFDHQSYVNFPIIIFNLGLALCLVFQKNIKLFILFFLTSNFWAYFVNPSYFIVTCLGPFFIFLCFLIYEKKFKLLILSTFLNLPFTLMYIFLSLGTARFAFGDLIKKETFDTYNFNIFESKLYLIILFLMTLLLINFFFKKKIKKFLTKDLVIFIFITFLTLIIGFLNKLNLMLPGLPHFIYIDYSVQYFYLAVISSFFLKIDLKYKIIFNSIFILLIIFKIYNHKNLIFSYTKFVGINSTVFENTEFTTRYFWQSNNKFIFSKKYKNKRFLIDFPTEGSDLKNKICKKNSSFNSCKNKVTKIYNKIFGHSFLWHEYQESSIVVNFGHSLMKGINSSAFFYPEINNKVRIPKNSILRIHRNFPINTSHNYDYILSDIILDYQLVDVINYKNFNLYIYKFPSRQNYKIKNIYKINSYKDYKNNFFKFNDNLFLDKDNNLIDDIKVNFFCDFDYIVDDTKFPKYLIKSKNNKKCFFVFPIPYSKTNEFYLNEKKIETIKSQYFFHGKILKNNDLITHKKKNLILYSWFSMMDYIDFLKFNNYD